MRIYPVLGCKHVQYQTNFNGLVPQKEIKHIGTDYIKRSEMAKDREEIYDVASRYFYEGIMPLIEKKYLCQRSVPFDTFRQEVINAAASKIELEFNPEFISFKKNAEKYSLNKEKNTFKDVVGTVNTITKSWKKIIDRTK